MSVNDGCDIIALGDNTSYNGDTIAGVTAREVLTQIELDLAYSSEKVSNLELLVLEVVDKASDYEILANVANNWGYFVLLSWMPVHFKTMYNVNLKQAAWFNALLGGVMALSGYIVGAVYDFLINFG